MPLSRQGPAFSSLMDALGGRKAENMGASLPWAHRQGSSPIAPWPAAATPTGKQGAHNAPLFGLSHLQARWQFAGHRKLLEATEKLECSRQALSGEGMPMPPVPLFR